MEPKYNISFLELIAHYRVKIPIIQRDYAQGRTDAKTTEIRRNFLDEIVDALAGVNEKPLLLDFIYGSAEEGCFIPLDGQQRLTTLFLLHWYLCPEGELGLLATEKKDSLFGYEVRLSSKGFCNQLSTHSLTTVSREGFPLLSAALQNESWFIWEWEKDPTVKGMLVMLDCMDERMAAMDRTALWKRLQTPSYIRFNMLPLDKFGLTDELYVKMNARGKELTDFDKFKSTLEEQLQRLGADDALPEQWGGKVDNEWMNVFWNQFAYGKVTEDTPTAFVEEVEKRYLRFFRCMMFYYLYTHDDIDPGDWRSLDKLREDAREDILKLLPKLVKTSFFSKEFFGFFAGSMQHLIYKDGAGRACEGSLLLNYKDWWKRGKEWEGVDSLFRVLTDPGVSYKNRVLYFALLEFYRYVPAGQVAQDAAWQEELGEWMGCFWNLASNTAFDDWKDVYNALNSIVQLAKNVYGQGRKILPYLASDAEIRGFSREQIVEERKKAYLSLLAADGSAWRELFESAEAFPLLSGAIRVLFASPAEKEAEESLAEATACWQEMQRLFDENGVRREYRSGAELLKVAVSQVEDPGKMLWWNKRIFNHEASTWSGFFISSDWHKIMHSLLQGDRTVMDHSTVDWHRKLYTTNLLDYIANNNIMKLSWIRDKIHGHTAIYPSGEGVFLNAGCRDLVLSSLLAEGKISLNYGEQVPETSFFKGWKIQFYYKELLLEWYEDDKIYLMKNEKEYAYANNDYVYFDTSNLTELEAFQQTLDVFCEKWKVFVD